MTAFQVKHLSVNYPPGIKDHPPLSGRQEEVLDAFADGLTRLFHFIGANKP